MDKMRRFAAPSSWYHFPVSRARTVRASIFLSVSLLLVCVLVAFSLAVYDYASFIARERFSNALTSLSRSVLTNLDSRVAEMDRVSLTLIYSQVFQNLYKRHLAFPISPSSDSERIAKMENTEALIEIAETVLGPNQLAPQVNIFDLRGEMIGAGYFSQLIERSAASEPWYAEVQRARGDRVMLPPHIDSFLDQTSVIVKGKRYMSLLRSFRDSLLSTRGVVEVEQYCDTLFSELDMLGRSSASVFAFDREGRLIYPYDGASVDLPALHHLAAKALSDPPATGVLPGGSNPLVFAASVSKDTGWTLLIGEPLAGLATNVLQYALRIALLALAAIICSLAASYFIARRVTVPIKALHAEIEALDLVNLDRAADGSPTSQLGEIEELHVAFDGMRIKLNDSIREVVSLREHEREAQLVALQSQLNPHFLHNMLQTISIMAEEGSPAAIQDLILNLASVLQYASSTEGTTATLGTELEYIKSYLTAMRARFSDSLEYVIDVPGAMREITVPRLILQPFIENCFKYGTSNRPPWNIALRGVCTSHRWTIEIADNGPGFDSTTLARITERLAAKRDEGVPLPMSISGMGILNSYERLRLAFGDRVIFEIDNGPAGGARVLLGAVDGG